MNVEFGTEAEQFLFWEYLFRIFGIVSLQCVQFLNFSTFRALALTFLDCFLTLYSNVYPTLLKNFVF
jgi:hypothetical protein